MFLLAFNLDCPGLSLRYGVLPLHLYMTDYFTSACINAVMYISTHIKPSPKHVKFMRQGREVEIQTWETEGSKSVLSKMTSKLFSLICCC